MISYLVEGVVYPGKDRPIWLDLPLLPAQTPKGAMRAARKQCAAQGLPADPRRLSLWVYQYKYENVWDIVASTEALPGHKPIGPDGYFWRFGPELESAA